MPSELIFMIGFAAFTFIMMAVDLGLFGKSDKPVSLKQAGITSAVWVSLALIFYVLIMYYGDLLHHVDSFAALQKINTDHLHHLKLNSADFAGGLELYRKSLALEFITG